MNPRNLIIGTIAIAAIIGVAAFVNSSKDTTVASNTDAAMQNTESMEAKNDENKMPNAEENGMMDKSTDGDAMAEKDDGQVASAQDAASQPGTYKDYSAQTVRAEQQAGNKVVLFFHANWCPFCRTADQAFRSNTNQIPAGVTVLKTDYDSNTELKKKYGVTYQHTFVQIDAAGNAVTKWNSGDVDLLKQNIK